MILKNDNDKPVGFFKLECGNLVYLDDKYDSTQINAYMVLSIEKLGKKNTCTTYKFLKLSTNNVQTYYLNHGLSWQDLQFVIKQ